MVRLPALLLLTFLAACAGAPAAAPPRDELPGLYYRMLRDGTEGLEARLKEEGIQRNTGAVLAGALLYTSAHPSNPCRGDRSKLELALRAGDLLATESEGGALQKWLNHRWLVAPWIDGTRLLERELGEDRRARWRREIEKGLADMAADVAERERYPRFASPFILTSPNHLSIWASTVHAGGKHFGNREWEELGARVMRRFAEEQAPDGYWGEHSEAGPTTGYNYLTTSSVAYYYEKSGDPAALRALRRATDFHAHFTWPDGTPVEVVNDRNRHGGVSAWGHFGFSNFPDGRSYARFLAGFLGGRMPRGETLARLAQNALYYHEGPSAPLERDGPSWVWPMKVPALIRREGPWWIAISGILSTPAPRNRFYLDRQGHLSVFHEKAGLVISGANSKRQPELATFSEKVQGQTYHLPLSSRLDPGGRADRLALSYNTFWAAIEVRALSADRLEIAVDVTRMGTSDEARLTLQLGLKSGEGFETGKGMVAPGLDRVDLEDVGGLVRQRGWTLAVDSPARLAWPVFPFNPYADGPETDARHAVGALSVPLKLEARPGRRLRGQEIRLTLRTD